MFQIILHRVRTVDPAVFAEGNGIEGRIRAILVEKRLDQPELVPGIARLFRADGLQEIRGFAL